MTISERHEADFDTAADVAAAADVDARAVPQRAGFDQARAERTHRGILLGAVAARHDDGDRYGETPGTVRDCPASRR